MTTLPALGQRHTRLRSHDGIAWSFRGGKTGRAVSAFANRVGQFENLTKDLHENRVRSLKAGFIREGEAPVEPRAESGPRLSRSFALPRLVPARVCDGSLALAGRKSGAQSRPVV